MEGPSQQWLLWTCSRVNVCAFCSIPAVQKNGNDASACPGLPNVHTQCPESIAYECPAFVGVQLQTAL